MSELKKWNEPDGTHQNMQVASESSCAASPKNIAITTQMQELRQTGLVAWSGRKLSPIDPVAQVRGKRTMAELLLEDRV